MDRGTGDRSLFRIADIEGLDIYYALLMKTLKVAILANASVCDSCQNMDGCSQRMII